MMGADGSRGIADRDTSANYIAGGSEYFRAERRKRHGRHECILDLRVSPRRQA